MSKIAMHSLTDNSNHRHQCHQNWWKQYSSKHQHKLWSSISSGGSSVRSTNCKGVSRAQVLLNRSLKRTRFCNSNDIKSLKVRSNSCMKNMSKRWTSHKTTKVAFWQVFLPLGWSNLGWIRTNHKLQEQMCEIRSKEELNWNFRAQKFKIQLGKFAGKTKRRFLNKYRGQSKESLSEYKFHWFSWIVIRNYSSI